MKQQQLLDLIEHTAFACGVEYVRICAEGSAHIQSYRSDNQVVMYGYCITPPTKSYGIVDNRELYSLLTNPSLSLIKQEDNLLTFENAKTGNSVVYSFVTKKRIDELLRLVKPKVKFDFDAVAFVTDDFVERLKKQAKICEDEWVFHVKSYIDFQIGELSATVQGNILLPADYPHIHKWDWDIDLLIKILSQSGDYKLSISSQGFMGIECKTEHARYQYYLPALVK